MDKSKSLEVLKDLDLAAGWLRHAQRDAGDDPEIAAILSDVSGVVARYAAKLAAETAAVAPRDVAVGTLTDRDTGRVVVLR